VIRCLTFCLRFLLASFAITSFAITAGAQPATAIVNVGGMTNTFSPQTVTINVGDNVTFVNKGGFHNVVADDGSFRCARGCDGDGNNGSGNASSSNWVASVTFNDAGTVGYFCEIHGMPGVGMFGTITVIGAAPPPPPPPDPTAVPGGNASFYALLSCALALVAAARLRRRRR